MTERTYGWACACMGPVYGEQFCPCDMTRRGLPSSPEHIKANAAAEQELSRLFGVGGPYHKPAKEPTP